MSVFQLQQRTEAWRQTTEQQHMKTEPNSNPEGILDEKSCFKFKPWPAVVVFFQVFTVNPLRYRMFSVVPSARFEPAAGLNPWRRPGTVWVQHWNAREVDPRPPASRGSHVEFSRPRAPAASCQLFLVASSISSVLWRPEWSVAAPHVPPRSCDSGSVASTGGPHRHDGGLTFKRSSTPPSTLLPSLTHISLTGLSQQTS